jgi:hypothetical protein
LGRCCGHVDHVCHRGHEVRVHQRAGGCDIRGCCGHVKDRVCKKAGAILGHTVVLSSSHGAGNKNKHGEAKVDEEDENLFKEFTPDETFPFGLKYVNNNALDQIQVLYLFLQDRNG